MNFTFTGFVLIALFVLPGAIWTGYYSGQFQTNKHSSTELVIESIGFSIIIHFLLFWIIFCTYAWKIPRNPIPPFFDQFSSKRMTEFQQLTVSEYMRLLMATMGYVLLSAIAAYGFARLHCFFGRLKKVNVIRKSAVFQNLFDSNGINHVRLTMNDGIIILGQIKYYPQDYDSIHSDSRDLILTGVTIIKENKGILLSQYADQGMESNVLVKTSDIKLLELVRPASIIKHARYFYGKRILLLIVAILLSLLLA